MSQFISVVVASLLLAVITPAPGLAQRQGFSGSAEASASLFQGNTEQRALFTKGELGRADSTLQVRGMMSFGYADAGRDTLQREVTKRTWLGSLSLDYRPYAHFSPFVMVNYESSFEKRILDRVGIGVGGKAVLISKSGTEANFSLALLSERTRPTHLSPNSDIISTARWSGRARVIHKFDQRFKMSHTTFFQPKIANINSYTVNSTSEMSYALRASTSLILSYQSLYDRSARARGARSNNDAQMLIGVKTAL